MVNKHKNIIIIISKLLAKDNKPIINEISICSLDTGIILKHNNILRNPYSVKKLSISTKKKLILLLQTLNVIFL